MEDFDTQAGVLRSFFVCLFGETNGGFLGRILADFSLLEESFGRFFQGNARERRVRVDAEIFSYVSRLSAAFGAAFP